MRSPCLSGRRPRSERRALDLELGIRLDKLISFDKVRLGHFVLLHRRLFDLFANAFSAQTIDAGRKRNARRVDVRLGRLRSFRLIADRSRC